MSLKTYYASILAGRKAGFPTRDEAREDFNAMLVRLTLVRSYICPP